MISRKKPEWEVRAYGRQLDEIDTDLLAQVVILLGKQFANEATEEGDEEAKEGNEATDTNHPTTNKEGEL